MRKQFEICLTAFLVFVGGGASAVTKASGYAQDGSGSTVRSASGLCWRTGYWSPNDAAVGCDGELVPPIGKPTAPEFLPVPRQVEVIAPLAVQIAKRCDFQLTLDSDSTFKFGSDHLSAPAKNHVASKLHEQISKCSKIESVSVSAYSDRLGTKLHNQQLSERRAASLSAIVASLGITVQIEKTGFGDTQSNTKCAQYLPKPQLIHCLAPDRRATITVRGSGK